MSLAHALAAYREGRPDEAAALAESIIRETPGDPGAHFLLGVVHQESGRLDESRLALGEAVQLAPRNLNFRITLGNLELEAGDYQKALEHFEAALELEPASIAARTNLGTARKHLGDLPGALEAYRAVLRSRRSSRWWPGEGATSPADPNDPTFLRASRSKLEHDLAQIELLMERDRLPDGFNEEHQAFKAVLADFGGESEPHTWRALRRKERAAIEKSYNRVFYRPPEGAPEHRALSPDLDVSQISSAYRSAEPRAVVIDDFLTPEALTSLRRFCEEATVWFDCKEVGGYLGAYMNEGFDPPELVSLARELPDRLPEIFADHRLQQMWGFKYGADAGTRMHADKAAINVNFWLTADEACLDPERSGLRIYPVSVPPGWDFARYNYDPTELRALVAEAAPVEISYRANRCVVFDSSLVHETAPFRFREGYAERRTNVTMLFGERTEER